MTTPSSAANISFPREDDLDRDANPRHQAAMVSMETGLRQQHAEGLYVMNRHGDGGMLSSSSSTLPPFAHVWSNSEFVSNQDLLAQMTTAASNGQHPYQQQSQHQMSSAAESQAMMMMIDGNVMAAPYRSEHGIFQISRPQPTVAVNNNVNRSPSSVDVATPGVNGWSPWQQPNAIDVDGTFAAALGVSLSDDGVVAVYRMPSDGSLSSDWHSPALGNDGNAPERRNGGQSTTHGNLFDPHPQISTNRGARFGGDAAGVYRAPNPEDDGSGGRPAVVDAEKLLLRSALLEKSEEVMRLMKELEQAYGLIHELKQQNDFFLHHKTMTTPSSSSSFADASSGAP